MTKPLAVHQPIRKFLSIIGLPVAKTGQSTDIYCISGNVGIEGSPLFHTRPENSAVKVFRVNSTCHDEMEAVDNMLTNLEERLSVNAAYTHANIAPSTVVNVIATTIHGITTVKALATPWYSVGDVLRHVKTCPTVNKLVLLIEFAKAVRHLHAHDVVHGAIHPSNVLVNNDGHVVLVDAGVHTMVSQLIFLPSCRLPIPPSANYKSSEQLCPATDSWVQPTMSMDVYSFATTAWAIFAGKEPFSDLSRFRTTEKIVVEIHQHGHRRLIKPSDMGAELWVILQGCLAADPVLRPTMSEVVAQLESLSL